MIINWVYVNAHPFGVRFDGQAGEGVGKLEFLLQAGMHYDEVSELRRITTKARLVSDYLDEVEERANGLVPGSCKESN